MSVRSPFASVSGFDDQFEQAQNSIFRLETLQCYGNSGEDPALAAFLADQPYLITEGKRTWISLVRDRVAAGCRMQRVHVVTEPLTDYVRFELTWGYAPNVDAGEEIHLVPVTEDQTWPADLPEATDFWLFDSAVLYGMHYDLDGTWRGVELVTAPDRVVEACRWREAALRHAVPWRRYIDQRPWLAQHLEGIPTTA
ncbi:MAG: DUF6879 family protein [Pseudonocardiaceae bacterium]